MIEQVADAMTGAGPVRIAARTNSALELDIEITEEMISAAAEVLWKDPLLEISESWAEEKAREMLLRVWSKYREKTDAIGPEVPQRQ
jgi:hypothetical protein